METKAGNNAEGQRWIDEVPASRATLVCVGEGISGPTLRPVTTTDIR